MNTPTRQAPHIWSQLFLKISASWVPVGRWMSATMIQDARIAVPATNGLKLNSAVIVGACAAPSGLIEDAAETLRFDQLMSCSLNQPVQKPTTTTRTMMGRHAWRISPPDRP